MCTTSLEAYKFALGLCSDYEEKLRKKEEKQPKRPEWKPKKPKSDEAAEGPSRRVTDIDYEKHEDTVKEIELQEKQERFIQKQVEAANRPPNMGCSHDHQKEWAIYEKPFEEKVQAADRFRLEGNEAYNKQNYGLAAVHYRKALLQFDYTIPENPAQEQRVDEVKILCLLNLAACKCQQEEWDEVLTQCRLALEINPRSVKAYYRTGQAYLARDQFELAKDALLSAYEIEPKEPSVLALLKKLKQKMATYKIRQKEVFTTMVSKVGEEPEAQQDTDHPDPSPTPEASAEVSLPESRGAQESTEENRASADATAEGIREHRPESSEEPSPSHAADSVASKADKGQEENPPQSQSLSEEGLRHRSVGTAPSSSEKAERNGMPPQTGAKAVEMDEAEDAEDDEDEGETEKIMQLMKAVGGDKVLCWILVVAVSLAMISVGGLVAIRQMTP